MAGASLLTLIDDIAAILDDVAVLTKVAAKKTAGVLGDDLALNAQQVSGVKPDRELPVVWAVAKGSALNKALLVPTALAIGYFAPAIVVVLLMIGGTYLCFEGAEKIWHKFFRPEEERRHQNEHRANVIDASVDIVRAEKTKIRGAIRTDFILSAEIIVIGMGTVSAAPFSQRVAVLVTLSVAMTVGVYGLVAGLVKLDDLGLFLSRKPEFKSFGKLLLGLAPKLMKFLGVAGTLAMFLVGGSILLHGIPGAEELVHRLEHALDTVPVVGTFLGEVGQMVVDALAGAAAGGVALAVVSLVKRVMPSKKHVQRPASPSTKRR